MVRKKQLDRVVKKRGRWKGDDEEQKWDSAACHALDALQAIVFQGANDRSKSALLKELYKRSPLLAAAYCGHQPSVEALLKAGNDLNVTARDGSTPLMLAISQGHTDIALKMLEANVNATIVNQEGYGAINLALRMMDTAVFHRLWNQLEKLGRTHSSVTDKGNKSLLHAAAEIGWDYGVAFLLGRSSTDIEQKGKDGKTPMMCAAVEGRADIVGLFLQAGAHILAEDQTGSTAACLAICRHHDTAAKAIFGKMSSAEKERYVSRRISLLLSPTSSARDYRCFYRDTLFKVLLFIRRHLEGGPELLLSHGVFNSLVACCQRCRSDPSVVGPLFHLCACLMHDKADYSKYVYRDMVEAFMGSGGLELALGTLGNETDSCEFQSRCSALLPLLLVTEVEEGRRWVREHLDDLVKPFREFSFKKDMLAYSTDGERIKTNVMWERFSETFGQLYLEARGKVLNSGCPVGNQHESNFVPLLGTAVKRKSPPIKSCKPVVKKTPLRPRAIPAMLQVTFNEDSRIPNKVRRPQQYVQRPEPKVTDTKPMNVLEVMSRAPTVAPQAPALQGYANALKTNLPEPEPSCLVEEALQPKFEFTTERLVSPQKTRDQSFPVDADKSSTEDHCSSQPCSKSASVENCSVRRVRSDPNLSSSKEKTESKLKLVSPEPNVLKKPVITESSELCLVNGTAQSPPIPMEVETISDVPYQRAPSADDTLFMVEENEHEVRSSEESKSNSSDSDHADRWAIPGQSKHKLCCKKLHYLQEHLFRQIQCCRKSEQTGDVDTATATLLLAETMLKSMNSLLLKPIYKANCSLDPRVQAQPLYTLDIETLDSETKEASAMEKEEETEEAEETEKTEEAEETEETVPKNELESDPKDGAWSGNFASVASREIAYDEKANLSCVWLSENQRWKSVFADVANAPLNSLGAVNGFFYSENKKNFLTALRCCDGMSVHPGIAKSGREVMVKKVRLHWGDCQSIIENVRNFKKNDFFHGNINEFHVTWKKSSSCVYVLWHPQDRNLDQYMFMLRERKLSLMKWGRMAMAQLLDALAFIHSRQHPVIHGRLKPSNILISPKGNILLTDLLPRDVLPSVPCGLIETSLDGPPKMQITDVSWRPRELIVAETEEFAASIFTTASDMQVAGMLIYYMLTGCHPFGKCDDDCQLNILDGRVIIRPVNLELDDLLHHLLALEPEYRLSATAAMRHPVFWGPRKRLFFLSAVALEMDHRKEERNTEGILHQLNKGCKFCSDWTSRVPREVIKDAFPDGDPPDEATSLLKLIKRCTLDYDAMCPEARNALKQPEMFFAETFPSLLMTVHGVVRRIHWRYSPPVEAFF